MLGLTLRSGEKRSLQLVLLSLALFHGLSFLSKPLLIHKNKSLNIIYYFYLVALWLLKTSDTTIKSAMSIILHLFCLVINIHFYRSINRTVSPSLRNNKLKTYFNSMITFPSPSATDYNTGHESS
jgi:hypothetical protein